MTTGDESPRNCNTNRTAAMGFYHIKIQTMLQTKMQHENCKGLLSQVTWSEQYLGGRWLKQAHGEDISAILYHKHP